MNVFKFLETRGKSSILIFGIFLFGIVAYVDYVTGQEIASSIFYLVPIVMVGRYAGRLSAIIYSFIAAVIWFSVDLTSSSNYSHFLIPFWNASVRLGIFLIVTLTLAAQKKFEQKSKQLFLQQEALLANIPDMVWLKDNQGCYIAVNETFSKVVGRTSESLVGKTDLDIWPKELAEKYRMDDREVMGSGKCKQVEELLAVKDQKTRWVEKVKTPVFNEKGDVIGIAGVAHDITERRESQNVLRESEQKFRAIFDNATDGLLMAEVETKKLYMSNGAICTMTGYTAEELKMLTIQDIHPEKDLPFVVGQFEKLYRKEIKIAENIPVKRKDGSIFYADITGFMITIANENYLTGTFRDITEREESEKERQKLMREFYDLYNNAPCGYHSLDTNSVFVRINDTELSWLGYAREELIGEKKFLDILTPESVEVFKLNFPRFKERGWIKDVMLEVVRKNGTIFPVLASATAVKDSDGNFLMSRSTLYDITDRRKAEEKNYQLASIVQSSDDAITGKTLDGVITTWNKGAEKIYGYAENEIVGKSMTVLIPPALEKDLRQLLERVKEGEHIQHYETLRLRKDGSVINVSLTLSPIKDDREKIIGVSSIAHDITAQKKVDEKLRQLSLAVEQSPGVIAITNMGGNLEYVNPKFCAITGYKIGEVIGKNPRILKSGTTTDEKYKELWEKIKRGEEWKGEFYNKRKDGSFYWEAASISQVKNSQGVATHYIKIGEDITERKKIEKMKDEFISMVSHELRTPLTAIKESVGIVADGTAGELNKEQKEILEIGKRNVDRLARLINDVLDFQKVQAGKMKFVFEEQDINQIVQEAAQTMLPVAAKDKNLELRIENEKDLPKIKVDRDRIMQVLINLLSNAIKFTEKGFVKITTSKSGENALLVSVIDSGIGIKQEDIEKLFQTFSQLNAPGQRKTGSSGLGLAISKEIVLNHKGKLWVESEYGKGSSFYMLLPVVERRKGEHYG